MVARFDLPTRAAALLLGAALSVSTTQAAGNPSFTISPLPITTPDQKRAGVSGGEGFQLVMDIAYSPSNPDVVYLGSDTSQVWKSVDGGGNWSPINSGYHAVGSRSIAVHPLDDKVVFSAGTLGHSHDKVGHLQPLQGIYLSTSGGTQWQMVHETGFFKQESRGRLFAFDSRTLTGPLFTVYAASYDEGLLVSSDGGGTWRQTAFKSGEILDLAELPAAPGTLLVAARDGLFSFDGKGQRRVGEGLDDWPRSIAVSPAKPGVVYAALGGKGIYRSTDQGNSFERLLGTAPLLGVINDVEISPADASVVMFTKSGKKPGPYYSTDGGQHWTASKIDNSTRFKAGGAFYFPSPLAMHPTRPTVALTSSNGRARVLRTETKGQNWVYSSSGYQGARLRGAIFVSDSDMIFNLTDHGVWRTTDNGQSFVEIEVPRIGGRSIGGADLFGQTFVLAVGGWKTKHLVVSRDSGKTWRETGLSGPFRFVKAHNTRPGTFYADHYRTDDKGETWRKLSRSVVAVSPRDNDRVYSFAPRKDASQLLLSTDAGNAWQPQGAPLPVDSRKINQVVVDPFEPDRLYAATAHGVWIYEGGKWERRTRRHGMSPDAFGGTFVETVVAHPGIPGLLFAGRRSPNKGMGNGVFVSFDQGETWEQLFEPAITSTNIWSISPNPHSGTVFIGTAHGIYRLHTDRSSKR